MQNGTIQPSPQGAPSAPVSNLGNPQGFGSPPGGGPGGPPNSAVGQIDQMLRNPSVAPTAAGNNNAMAAGGLAGVATEYKAPSIKIYKDHQKYQEWEFIFDLNQNQPGAPGAQQNQPQNSPQQPTNPGSPIGTPPSPIRQ